MNLSTISTYFGQDHAAAYDQRWAKLAPMQEALHFLMRMVLSDLPREARILCVGAGTGAELIALARAFPGAHFIVVEPSGPMLAICRTKAEQEQINSRCRFHEGFLESLPAGEPFDAATSILVSQFLTDPEERRRYFTEIAQRLQPGGYLVNADLATSVRSAAFDSLFDIWLRTHNAASAGSAQPTSRGWGKDVAVSTPQEIESLIASAGFEQPILFHQALFIHAWYARTALDK